MGTADDIMRRQTKRIIIYVSTLLVLSCGTMLYDATFCSLKGDDEIVYSSPPCDNRDVLLASSNLFYTGEVRDVWAVSSESEREMTYSSRDQSQTAFVKQVSSLLLFAFIGLFFLVNLYFLPARKRSLLQSQWMVSSDNSTSHPTVE